MIRFTFHIFSLLVVYSSYFNNVKENNAVSVNYFFDKTDSFAKYSYLLTGYRMGYNKTKEFNIEVTATGFFVRRNNKLLLVVTRHTATEKKLDPPNKFAVWINKYENKSDLIILDISETENLPEFHRGKEPDIYIFDFSKLYFEQVYSIEKYINWNNTDYQKNDSGFLYSYHFPTFDSNRNVNSASLRIKNNKSQNIRTSSFVDSLNYVLEITSGIAGPGSSGGPIFIKRNGSIQFGGICISGFTEKTDLLAVRPEIVIRMIEEKANKKEYPK